MQQIVQRFSSYIGYGSENMMFKKDWLSLEMHFWWRLFTFSGSLALIPSFGTKKLLLVKPSNFSNFMWKFWAERGNLLHLLICHFSDFGSKSFTCSTHCKGILEQNGKYGNFFLFDLKVSSKWPQIDLT